MLIPEMKYIILLINLFLSTVCYSQDTLPQLSPGIVGYEKVISIDSTSEPANIYSKVLAWFNSTFKSGKAVIDMQDKESATIIAKPRFQCYLYTTFKNDGYVSYNFSVWAKKGRYKYVIDKLIWRSITNGLVYNAEDLLPTTSLARMNKRMARKTIEEINSNIKEIVDSFNSYMAKNDNW